MAVFRVKKDTNYVVMNKTSLNDTELTWKAKGILSYMLSMPDDWKFYMDELKEHSKDGLDSLKAGVKELKEAGYLKRFPIKENGKIVEWETHVYEVPQAEKPQVEKPLMGKPLEENPLLLSNEELSNDFKLSNKDINKVMVTEFVYLSEDEQKRLIEKYGETTTVDLIERLNDYIGTIGVKKANAKYKSHYHVISNWARRDQKERGGKVVGITQTRGKQHYTTDLDELSL